MCWSESNFDDCMVLTTLTATPMFILRLAAVGYSIRLLNTGVFEMMEIQEHSAFFFLSSILTVGLVLLVGMLAVTVALWGSLLTPWMAG